MARGASPAREGLVRIADSRYRLDGHRGLDGATPNEEELEALEGEEGSILERGERLRGGSRRASSCSRAAATA